MAAHALVIARQILDVIEHNPDNPARIVGYARGALEAPGTDGISYPCLRILESSSNRRGKLLGPDLYSALYMAAEGLVDAETGVGRYGVKPLPHVARVPFIEMAALDIVEHCKHLEHYRSLESAQSAFERFVKRGLPHYRKRRQVWDTWSPIISGNPPKPADCYR